MSADDFKEQIREQLKAKSGGDSGEPRKPNIVTRARRNEVGNMLREFSVLIAAEYPLHRALRLLAANTTNKHLAGTIEQVSAQVETGTPLWQCMARHPWYFDVVTISIVRASEAGGKLDEGLTYLADLWEQDQEIRAKLSQALSYPAVLLALFVGVILLLLMFVVPSFGNVLLQTRTQVHGAAAAVYWASEFLRTPYGLPLVLAALLLPVFLLFQWRRRNELTFDRWLGRIPVIGRLMLLAELARFVSMLNMLTRSGVGLLQGLDLSKGALGNAYLADAVHEMHRSVEQGKSMVEPLKNYREFPNRVKDMLSVAEESGKMEQMLSHLAVSMRAELIRTIDKLMVLLQPILLVVMGVVVLFTFLTFFYPYFDILTNLSQGR